MNLRESIDTYLDRARIAIDNALANETLLNALSEWGYTSERLQIGKTLYEAAAAAQRQQTQEYGEQIGATATLERSREAARKTYNRLIKVARAVLDDNPGALQELGLTGRRKQSLSGWLAQAEQFYRNALNNTTLLTTLGDYGITAAKLEAGLAEIQTVRNNKLIQETEKGEAQNATKVRDAAFEDLDTWLSRYLEIATAALEDQPQLLESLGLTIPS